MGGISLMPSVYADIAKTIRCRFGTEIEDVKNIPVQYDNMPFEQPNGAGLTPVQQGWIRLEVKPESSRQVDFGAAKRRFRVRGVAIALIHFPIEVGDKLNLEMADAIVDAFRGVTFQGVVFQTPIVRSLGRSNNDKDEWQTEVSCPFFKDNLI